MVFYRVVKTDGIGAVSIEALTVGSNSYFQQLRQFYLPYKIDFTMVTIDTIISNRLFDPPADTYTELELRKYNPDAINVYITNSLTEREGKVIYGVAPYFKNVVYITGGNLEFTLYHELGHAFGLLHTFAEKDNPRENIDQDGLNGCAVNARYTGDGLVDTPADYNNLIETSPPDQCGNTNYNPDKSNIMSYWRLGSQHFSSDQVKLMHAILNAHHARYMLNETPFTFGMETRLANGGTINNSYLLNDRKNLNNNETTPLLPGETYSSLVYGTLANGEQHHDWNGAVVEYRPKEYFIGSTLNSIRTSNRKPLFSLTPSGSVQEINLPFSTSIGFQDPWETKDQTTFKTLSAVKAIFKNESPNYSIPEKPFYQIKADAIKSYSNLNLSFQNWSGTNIDPLTNPNSLAPQPLVTNGVATITANYKAMLASLSTGWVTSNQFVSENGTASVMYVSNGNLWLHRENGSDKKEVLVSSSAGSIYSYSVTANSNNRYWVLNNGTTTPVCGYELNGVVGAASVPSLSGLGSSRIEIVRLNSATPQLALITKIGSTIYKSIGTLTSGVVTWGSWSSLTGMAPTVQISGNGNIAFVSWINGSSVLGFKLKTDGTWSSLKMITSSSSGSFTSMAPAVDPNGNLFLTLVRANTQTQKKDFGESA